MQMYIHRLINKWRLAACYQHLDHLANMRREAFDAALLVVAREIGHDSFRFYYSHDKPADSSTDGHDQKSRLILSIRISRNEIRCREYQIIRRNGERNSLAISIAISIKVLNWFCTFSGKMLYFKQKKKRYIVIR